MSIVGPQTFTQVPLVIDADPIGGQINMDGPVVGNIQYHQSAGDALELKITLEYGKDSKKYEVFLVDGPSHALATGFITIGALSTDANGAGSATLTVPLAALVAAPFHTGYLTCHVDMLASVGVLSAGSFTAGAINFFVCGGQRNLTTEEAVRFKVMSGEPTRAKN